MSSKQKLAPCGLEYQVAEEIYRLVSAYGNAVMEATTNPDSPSRIRKERTMAKAVFKWLFGREPHDAELNSLIPG